MTDHPGEAQAWADNHLALSRQAADLFHGIGDAFKALSAIQYAAPWRRSRTPSTRVRSC